MLVAGPGERTQGEYTTGFSREAYEHGWPFVACTTFQVEIGTAWGPVPPSFDVDESAANYRKRWEDLNRFSTFDSRFRMHELPYYEYGFWTEVNRWPLPASGRALHWNWKGIAGNFIFVLLICGLIGVGLEFLIGKYPGFLTSCRRFSLRAWMLAMVMLAIIVGICFRAHSQSQLKLADLQRIEGFVESWDDGFILFAWEKYSTSYAPEERECRVPLLLSQLFDHRLHRIVYFADWFYDPKLIGIALRDGLRLPANESEKDLLKNTWKRIKCPVEFSAGQTDFTNELLDFFNLVDGAHINLLELSFDGYFDDVAHRKLWQDNVPLVARFDDLALLELRLDYGFDTAVQLQPFMRLKNLKSLEINFIDMTAASQLLESELAPEMELKVVSTKGVVSDEVLEQLSRRFRFDEERVARSR